MAMTRKEFWIDSYVALLHRYDPDQAITLADKALDLCDARWEKSEVQLMHRQRADMPVGQPDLSQPASLYHGIKHPT